MRLFSVIIAIILCVLYTEAQIPDTTALPRDVLVVTDTLTKPHSTTLSFERLLSSYQWNLNHQTNYANHRWFLMVDENFRSGLIRTDRQFIKDQQELRVLGGRRVSDRVDVRVLGSSLFLSDNRITGLHDTGISDIHGGVGYIPFDNVSVVPYVGYTIDRQAEKTDYGWSYLARLRGEDVEFAETFLNIDGQFSLQRVDPRTTASHYINVDIDRQFDEQTSVYVQSYYTYSRREFYFPADDVTRDNFNVAMNIDQRFDRRFGTAGEVQYAVRDNIFGVVSTSIDWRTVTRDYFYQPTVPVSSYLFGTSVDEFSLNVRLGLQYFFGERFTGSSHLIYSERSEEHRLSDVDDTIPTSFVEERAESEFRKNNISQRTSLATRGTIRLAQGHRFRFAGSTSILRYDTPSPLSFDDRDELRILINAGTHHELNRYLTLDISADVVLAHVVYLQAQRSANNNWNRVLRLTPSLTFEPFDWLKTTNAFEVMANYTVYDFEDMLTNLRSLSYRQVGWIDSTRVQLTENTRFDFFSHYRRYERGELRWNAFAERPLHSFEEVTLIASLRYDVRPGSIAFAGGIRYFNRNRYRYNQHEREFESQLRNVGPTCYVFWDIDQRVRLTIQGWYELQFRDRDHTATIPNMSIDIGARF